MDFSTHIYIYIYTDLYFPEWSINKDINSRYSVKQRISPRILHFGPLTKLQIMDWEIPITE